MEVERNASQAIGQPTVILTAYLRCNAQLFYRTKCFGVSPGISRDVLTIADAWQWRTYRFFGLSLCDGLVIPLVCRSTSRATLKSILCASS